MSHVFSHGRKGANMFHEAFKKRCNEQARIAGNFFAKLHVAQFRLAYIVANPSIRHWIILDKNILFLRKTDCLILIDWFEYN